MTTYSTITYISYAMKETLCTETYIKTHEHTHTTSTNAALIYRSSLVMCMVRFDGSLLHILRWHRYISRQRELNRPMNRNGRFENYTCNFINMHNKSIFNTNNYFRIKIKTDFPFKKIDSQCGYSSFFLKKHIPYIFSIKANKVQRANRRRRKTRTKLNFDYIWYSIS